jgi:hypothetical protein
VSWYNDFKKDNRRAIINLVDSEYLMCSFYEDDRSIGEIEYPDKSYHYVRDAAENWIEGIMTADTVKMYKV